MILDVALLQKAKVEAAETRTTATAILEAALRAWLDEGKKK